SGNSRAFVSGRAHGVRMTPDLSRRQALGAAGAATLDLLLRAHGAQAAALTPAKTIGPYFVDEKLKRSDIRGGVDGLPLALALTLLDGGAAVAGAQVDIWHAAPDGTYSDEAVEGTTGKTYLRGYQISDAQGKVAFTTVYPGWYAGRTVHLHVRIR